MKARWLMLALLLPLVAAGNSDCSGESASDKAQRQQQETLTAEATSQTGMPAIVNFRERKLLKDIYELRDQDGLVTYTYTFSEMTGQYKFFCNSVGYGIPYATQYSSPEKLAFNNSSYGLTLPQSEPNALFTPSTAEGTWVMCKDPDGPKTLPIYIEPRVIVSPFRLPER